MNGLTSEYDAWAEIGLHNTAAAAVYSECSSDHMAQLSVCVCTIDREIEHFTGEINLIWTGCKREKSIKCSTEWNMFSVSCWLTALH